MSLPIVVSVKAESAAAGAGVLVGDTIVSVNGEQPRDVIRYHLLVDEPNVSLELDRGGVNTVIDIEKPEGAPLGIEVESALFDQVRTCDNHCSFCFIYQLPPGLRKSLYLKDDDFRLSFLYGNFTTLTRFTEADLERVVTERLSPLYVSIHATDPDVRAELLRNRRGATSLRWLRALLDHSIEVHGQLVICPGINDGDVLETTLADILDEYPELKSLAVVPLGISKHSHEPDMEYHSPEQADRVCTIVAEWQDRFQRLLGHRLVFASDEYYLLANRDFPAAETYEGFEMHEDGIGMARTFQAEFSDAVDTVSRPKSGFFASVDGARGEGYRANRLNSSGHSGLSIRPSRNAPVAVLTGPYGAQVLGPLLAAFDDARIVTVQNKFFGGNVGVAGLMVGADIVDALAEQPPGHRYLLPDVCLSGGLFLDGTSPSDLPYPVEIVPTDGHSLRAVLEGIS